MSNNQNNTGNASNTEHDNKNQTDPNQGNKPDTTQESDGQTHVDNNASQNRPAGSERGTE